MDSWSHNVWNRWCQIMPWTRCHYFPRCWVGKNPLKWNLNLIKRALLPASVTLSSPSIRQNPSGVPSWPAGVRVAKAWAPRLCTFACVWKEFLHVASLSAHSPFASLRLWQSVVPEWSFVPVGPSHPCTRWPSTRFFHPVGSRTHLFSTSKTQGLRGVMIGFLLCNLLEFCLTSKMAFSCPLHAHTPSEVCPCCKQLSVDL